MSATATMYFTAERLALMVGEQLGPAEVVAFFEALPQHLCTRPWYVDNKTATNGMRRLCKALQVNIAKAAKRVLHTL